MTELASISRRNKVLITILLFLAIVAVVSKMHGSVEQHVDSSTRAQDVILPSQVQNYVGQIENVKFNVGYTYVDAAGTEFLDQYQNYQSGFVVCIFSSDLQNFLFDPASTYDGDSIVVTGPVSIYNGYYQILNPTKIVVAQ